MFALFDINLKNSSNQINSLRLSLPRQFVETTQEDEARLPASSPRIYSAFSLSLLLLRLGLVALHECLISNCN